MVADTHVTGSIVFGRGKSLEQAQILCRLDSEIADNAAGSEPYYAVPDGAKVEAIMPRNDGQQIPGLPRGPHWGPGDLVLLGCIPSSANGAADVDTTGATSDVYNFSYAEYEMVGGKLVFVRTRIIGDETQRSTVSGVAPPTDPKINTDLLVWTHAWGPLPPGRYATLVGRVRVDLRSAT